MLHIALIASVLAAPPAAWPSFRGPNADGLVTGQPLPVHWDGASDAGIAWRTPIPGLGHSSPVIAGDRLFVTTAVGDRDAPLKVGLYGAGEPVEDEGEQSWRLLCLDRRTGAVLWDRECARGKPTIERHPKSSHASPTPATNGTHVVAFFGSEGLHCHDMEGNHLWSRDLGVLDAGAFNMPDYQWGFAASPIIHGDRVIVQCDVQGDSFVAALSLADGSDVWRTPREENPTWSTPTIAGAGDDAQVVCNGYLSIAGYDLDNGLLRWWMRGGGDVPVPTPVVGHDLIFITNAHGRDKPVYAIRTSATGEVMVAEEEPDLAWHTLRLGNYMQTPLLVGDELYCCHDTGVLTCFDARTGTVHYRERLGAGATGFSASPVGGDGKVYVTSEEGDVHVIRAGKTFEVLAINEMGATCMATPAIADGVIYWRTRSEVVAVVGMANGSNATVEDGESR